MNKLNKLFAGFAAVAMLASCSNDEPVVPAPVEDGSTMYLNINITDASGARSRADGDSFKEDGTQTTAPVEGDYTFGSVTEHEVSTADFLFYDEDGRYLTRASVWTPDGATSAPNIEYMGKNTLVLRNLTKENLPAYMITVLNAPATNNVSFAKQVENNNWTMEETRMRTMGIMNGNLFIMSTTSFIGTADRHDDKYYYATKLKTTDFLAEVPTASDVTNDNLVNVYVERLAAKFQLVGLDQNGVKKLDVTIAGMDNDDVTEVGKDENGNGGIASVSTNVYVKILGYGLTGQEKESYLSKNIDKFKTSDPWTNWSNPSFYRSFWGQSLSYGNAEPDLTYSTFVAAKNNPANPIYGIETTNDYTKIRTGESNSLQVSKVTNLLITARVYADEACTKALDLVEYNGLYFTKDQYKLYVLGKLQSTNQLNFWKNKVERSSSSSTETENGTHNITTTNYKYSGLEASDFEWAASGNGTGDIILKLSDDVNTSDLWKKPEGWTAGIDLVAATAEEINKVLADFNESTKATAFRGGSMYYSIPVEHLKGKNLSKDYTVTEEGEYGVVRNHWYQINVSDVKSFGNGVFYPGDLEDDTRTEELVPNDPKKDRFALAAKINILSWKIVQQNVEL